MIISVLLTFESLPSSFVLVSHLVLVAILLFIFPFSKLLHAPGLFFSPSRNQVDNPRERRHAGRAADTRANQSAGVTAQSDGGKANG